MYTTAQKFLLASNSREAMFFDRRKTFNYWKKSCRTRYIQKIRKVAIESRDGMTSPTGMLMHSSREGVCGNNKVQFQSCDGSSYCTALRKMAALILPPVNCEILVWSDEGAGNSFKVELMCTTKTLVANRPWWRQHWWKFCGKQFCRTGASHFRNSLVNSSRCLAQCCMKPSPGGRKTFPQRR